MVTRAEFAGAWARLRRVYDRLPAFDPALAAEWVRALNPYTGDELDEAVSMWIDCERFRPLPADIARYCRKARAALQSRAIQVEAENMGECAWCGGLGYVAIVLEPVERDRYFCCVCALSPNREQGAANLAAARADDGWIFDKDRHGFRRRRAWIGNENKPAATPANQQGIFRQMAAQVGTKI